MRDLIVGVSGVDIIKYCNAPLTSNTKVIVTTLELELPYCRAPWICMSAVGHQRFTELKNAFLVFGLCNFLLLDYPTSDDLELERLLAQLQMQLLLSPVETLYYSGENIILKNVCESLVNVKNKIQFLNQESPLSCNNKRLRAINEIKELL